MHGENLRKFAETRAAAPRGRYELVCIDFLPVIGIVLKIRTSFLKNPRPPYCVLDKQILAVYIADTLNDEIRGIDVDLGASGTKLCTLLW
jgi:hypothetical protein